MSTSLEPTSRSSNSYNARKIIATFFGGEEHISKFVKNAENMVERKMLTKAVIGRETAPTTGSVHLQCCFGTDQQRRFRWWKKYLIDSAGIELLSPVEGMPGGITQVVFYTAAQLGGDDENHKYCTKDGGVLLDIKEQRVVNQGSRTDLRFVFEQFRDGNWTCIRDVLMHNGGGYEHVVARHQQYVNTLADLFRSKDHTRGAELLTSVRAWQHEVLMLCFQDPMTAPNDRQINIVLDKSGASGKSFISRWLERIALECFDAVLKVQILRPGKLADMAHALETDNDVLIVDVPRSRSDIMQWNFLEMVKDGNVFSSKYNSTEKLLNPIPHVIVMCNRFDNRDENGRTVFSEDRVNMLDPEVIGFDMVALPTPTVLVEEEDPPTPPTSGPEFSSDEIGDGPSSARSTSSDSGDIRDHFESTDGLISCGNDRLSFDGVHGRCADWMRAIKDKKEVHITLHPSARELLPVKNYSETKITGWMPHPRMSDFRENENFCMKRGSFTYGSWYHMLKPDPMNPRVVEWLEMRRGEDTSHINRTADEIRGVTTNTSNWEFYLPKRYQPVLTKGIYPDIDFSPVWGYNPDFDRSSVPCGTEPELPAPNTESDEVRQERHFNILCKDWGFDKDKGLLGSYGSDAPANWETTGKRPPNRR